MGNPSLYLESLIKELSKLPGIGPKSATRLAFHMLKKPYGEVEQLSRALLELKQKITTCSVCGGIADGEVCSICTDNARDRSLVCVVESAHDVLVVEGTGGFKGLYHVLQGLLSPLDGIGPDDLNIASLMKRCAGGVRELILALNPTVEGDATSLYLARLMKPLGVRLTRIARGLPVGADLEFSDNATIMKSIEGRVDLP